MDVKRIRIIELHITNKNKESWAGRASVLHLFNVQFSTELRNHLNTWISIKVAIRNVMTQI